ncbi:MAG TPA: hypothetical protein VFC35_08380, partial [Gemmatimonadaceae bacterium]|nr:hypothetical protein [Gemmatimonadaceae bacterium]
KPGLESRLVEWSLGLTQLPWIDSVSPEGATVRIVVRDTEIAMRELPPEVLRADLVLIRYEMMRPSLEDVFLRLVGEAHAP